MAAIPRPSDTLLEMPDAFGLPALPRNQNDTKPIEQNFPTTHVHETLTKWMVDPLCCTQMTFPLRIEASSTELTDSMLLGHAMQVLESRLVEKMRFDRGAIYNVSAAAEFSATHSAAGKPIVGSASVSFTCQPRDVATLAQVVVRELETLKKEGPTTTEVETRAIISRREYETSVTYNSWWVDRLTTSFVRIFAAIAGTSKTRLRISKRHARPCSRVSPRRRCRLCLCSISSILAHTLSLPSNPRCSRFCQGVCLCLCMCLRLRLCLCLCLCLCLLL